MLVNIFQIIIQLEQRAEIVTVSKKAYGHGHFQQLPFLNTWNGRHTIRLCEFTEKKNNKWITVSGPRYIWKSFVCIVYSFRDGSPLYCTSSFTDNRKMSLPRVGQLMNDHIHDVVHIAAYILALSLYRPFILVSIHAGESSPWCVQCV